MHQSTLGQNWLCLIRMKIAAYCRIAHLRRANITELILYLYVTVLTFTFCSTSISWLEQFTDGLYP